ncbi:MAG TPA: YdbH domain-containing protein, partial [Caulobacteraceae bacterium]|nr:YdbH domain-containing protein [Caulobacteraceae bacterium]
GANGVWKVGLGAPVSLATAGGGRILLSPIHGGALARVEHGAASGAFTLASAGSGLPQAAIAVSGYRLAADGFEATVAGRAALSARGVQHLTLQTGGRLSLHGGDVRFDAATCGPVSVQRLQVGGEEVTGLAAQLCPAPGLATAEIGAKGWAVHARYADFTGVSASLAARLSGAAGTVDLRSGAPVQGVVQIASATVTDTSPTRRVEAIREAGVLTLASPQWTGRFDVSSRSGHPLGVVTARLDPVSGRGEALLEVRDLAFAKDGLQPGELSPIVASLSPMAGKVSFTGRIGWADGKVTSEGDFATDDLALRSPLGAVTGIAARIHLTSLAPLRTAPGQLVTAARVASLVPLAPVRLTFGLDPDGLDLQSASAGAEGGRITLAPTRLPFDPAGKSHGALSLEAFDLGKLIATSSLADKVDLEAVVSGVLPYTLGPDGLRFESGRLTAIRPGRISIHRDALTTGPVTNAVQDMAFQALQALDFSQLDATVQSRPQGRLGLIFHVVGSFEPKVEQQANLKIADILSGKALKSYVPLPSHTPVTLNLDSSLNLDQLLSDYGHAFQFSADTQPPPPQLRSEPVQR